MDNIILFYRAIPSDNNTVNLKVENNFATTLGIELGDSELSIPFFDTDRCTPVLDCIINVLKAGLRLERPGDVKEWFKSTCPMVGGVTVSRYKYHGADQTALSIFLHTTLISIVGDSEEISAQIGALLDRFVYVRDLLEKV